MIYKINKGLILESNIMAANKARMAAFHSGGTLSDADWNRIANGNIEAKGTAALNSARIKSMQDASGGDISDAEEAFAARRLLSTIPK
jgi:hypothetical protein